MEWKNKDRFFGAGVLGTFLGLSLLACGGTDTGSGSSSKCSEVNEGDFIITEFLANPKGTDDWQEYIEIYNPTANPINLKGVKLFTSKNDGSSEKSKWTINEATIQPGQYFTVGDFNTTPDEATGIVAQPYEHLDYVFDAKLSLPNSNGLIGFRCGKTIIDQVTYTAIKEAQAQILSGDKLGTAENDDEASWCSIPKEDEYIIASLPYVSESGSTASNYGTPKQANPECKAEDIPITVPEGKCMDNGVERDIVSPQVGEVVISEIMSWAAGNDKNHEYVELYAKGSFDLNGLILSKGTKDWTLSSNECLHVTANKYVVIAGTDDQLLNGGIPHVDVIVSGLDINQAGTITLKLDDATVLDDGTVGDDATVLDSVTYVKPAEGTSWQLSSDKLEGASGEFTTDFCASTASYSEGHYGTPGGANTMCDAQLAEGQCLGADGRARQIVSPASGDLLITEIMAKPTGENGVQWFEIYARSNVDLNNLVIKKGTTAQPYTIESSDCISLSTGDFAVVATVEDVNLEAAIVVVPKPKISLNISSNKNISLYNAAGVLIDSYDYATPTEGFSLQLTSTKFSSEREVIDNSADYCESAGAAYDTLGNVGTPGRANAECATVPGPADCSSIANGALIITEIMANPAGEDDGQEYVEVYNATPKDISLNGVTFTKANASGGSSKFWTFGEVSIAAGQYFVFGNYGPEIALPAHLDYAFSSAFAMTNTGGTLSLTCGEAMIDMARYPSASKNEGQALILNTLSSTANDDASSWCFIAEDQTFVIDSLTGVDGSKTNYGTPGRAGGTCAQ